MTGKQITGWADFSAGLILNFAIFFKLILFLGRVDERGVETERQPPCHSSTLLTYAFKVTKVCDLTLMLLSTAGTGFLEFLRSKPRSLPRSLRMTWLRRIRILHERPAGRSQSAVYPLQTALQGRFKMLVPTSHQFAKVNPEFILDFSKFFSALL
jgi:hypothetical protein